MIDKLQRVVIEETGAEKLERIGKTQVITSAAPFGTSGVIPVTYPTEEYKKAERFASTHENPEDTNGLGYQFTNIDDKEV